MEKCSFFALRLVDGMGAFAKVAPPPLPTEEMFPALDEGAGGDGSPHPRWKEGGGGDAFVARKSQGWFHKANSMGKVGLFPGAIDSAEEFVLSCVILAHKTSTG